MKELKKRIGLGKSGAGFTLVEILVVIGMIAVLTGAALMVINPALHLKRSRDATRKSEIKQIQSAVEQYKSDNGVYPLFNVGTYGWALATSLTLNSATTTYMQVIPAGPNLGGDSCKGYVVADSSTSYTIFTILENANDPDGLAVKPAPSVVPSGGSSADGYKTFSWTGGSCPNHTYNYWVNNP